MLRDGGLREREFLHQVAAAGFAFFLEDADECDACWVGEGIGKVRERFMLAREEFFFLVGHFWFSMGSVGWSPVSERDSNREK